MDEKLLELQGVNGQTALYQNRVVISRKGGFFKGNKEIMIDKISGIQLKPGTSMTRGYIQFTLPGGRENKKGLMDAGNDENTVLFAKKQNDIAEQLKNRIYELQKPTPVVTQAAPSAADEILKYKQLLDAGAINQEEYESKKKQLLK